MKLLTDDAIDRDKWNDFLKTSPYDSPFQTPAFYVLFNSVPGYAAQVFAIEVDHQLAALAVVTIQKEKGLKRFFSQRGIIYGGPVYDVNTPEALEALLVFIERSLQKQVIYLETRNFFDFSQEKSIFLKLHWKYLAYLNFQLDTSDDTLVRKAVSSSRMRQIKKAVNNNVSWKEAENLEEVHKYYLILKNLYNEKNKRPLYPWEFFKQLYEKKGGKYLLVFYNGQVIGGMACLVHPGKTIYEFYICGQDERYKEQYPSVLATWAAIEYAYLHGIPRFDFMGAGRPDQEYGVREFKARFGGELVEHGRFIKITKPVLYQVGKAGLTIMAKLKR